MNKVPSPRIEKYFEPKMQGGRVLTTFQIDKELWTEFRILMARDSRPCGNKLVEMIESYVKEHKDGNPQFTIDQFKDPDFVACPAFFRDLNYWNYYFSKQTPQELLKFKNQIIFIDRLMGKYL